MTLDSRTPARVFLSQQPWFGSMDPSLRETLINDMLLQRASRGELLVRRGTPVDAWWAVLSGMAKLQTEGRDGRVSAFLGVPAGDWFGEGTVLNGGPWRYDVVALRDTTLIGLPLAHFHHLYQTHLPFNHYLIARLNLRLGQAMTAIEAGRLRTPEERVAQYLVMFLGSGIRKITLTQEDFGHLTGLSRQTVNRVLKALEAKGWISLEFSRIEVLQPDALQALLNRR